MDLNEITAKELLSQNYKRVSVDDTLHKAITLFSDDTEVLLVFDGDDYKGILTEKQIIRSGLDRQNTKVRKLVMPAPKISVDEPITRCAYLMLENDVLQLPVFDGDNVLGIVSADNLLLRASDELFGDEKIRDLMSDDIIVCSPNDTLFKVLNLFKQYHISRVPVVSDTNGELIGIVSMHDLVEKAIQMDEHPDLFSFLDEKKPLFELPVENIMTFVVETVKPETSSREAINKMINNSINSLVVVDDDNRPVGMVTKFDLISRIASFIERKDQVSVSLALKVDDVNKEVVLSEINRFVEKRINRLGSGYLHCYFNTKGRNKSSQKAHYCSMRLITDKLRLTARGSSDDALKALRNCLDNLDFLINKALEKNKK